MVNKINENLDNPIDTLIYNIIDTQLDFYYKLGFTPNMITTISLVAGLFGVYQVYNNSYYTAGILWMIAYYYDCMDGKLARKYNMTSQFGDYYDHISDIIKFSLLYIILFIKLQNKTISSEKKYTLLLLFLVLSLLCFIQVGCQEQITHIKDSNSISFLDYIVSKKYSCEQQMKYLRYVGLGTYNMIVTLIIIFWDKI